MHIAFCGFADHNMVGGERPIREVKHLEIVTARTDAILDLRLLANPGIEPRHHEAACKVQTMDAENPQFAKVSSVLHGDYLSECG